MILDFDFWAEDAEREPKRVQVPVSSGLLLLAPQAFPQPTHCRAAGEAAMGFTTTARTFRCGHFSLNISRMISFMTLHSTLSGDFVLGNEQAELWTLSLHCKQGIAHWLGLMINFCVWTGQAIAPREKGARRVGQSRSYC